MTTLTSQYLTLLDRTKQTDGKGNIESTIIELLNMSNPVYQDAYAKECNDGSSNKTTVRTSLPEAEFRDFYGYITPSKSGTRQIVDKTGSLNALSVIDADLLEKSKNPEQFRLNEGLAFMEGMTQTFQRNFFYGNANTNPAGFDGLSVRYSKLSNDDTKVGFNVINGGGTGAVNTSIWFVTFGDLHTSLLYPEGSQAGIKFTKGSQREWETNKDGAKRPIYQDHYQHDVGVCVRDWRSTARIANIDIEELKKGNVKLDDLMLEAYYHTEEFAQTGKTFIYANREVCMALHKLAKDKANVHLDIEQYAGKRITTFLGVPIRQCRTILNTEAKVA